MDSSYSERHRINPLNEATMGENGAADAKPTWEQDLASSECTSLQLSTMTIPPREPVIGDWCYVGDLGVYLRYARSRKNMVRCVRRKPTDPQITDAQLIRLVQKIQSLPTNIVVVIDWKGLPTPLLASFLPFYALQ